MTPESQGLIPYIGPRPFLRQHRALFFGRDNEVSELLSLVISHRVILLYAQSGAGKTSLLNAGLVPVLEEEGFEVLPLARVAGLIPKGIEPKDIPNLYVFNTLMSLSEQEEADPGKLLEQSLAAFLQQRERLNNEEGRARPRVVIFDQFEELFSSYQERWAERKEFFERVADMPDDDPLLRVIFAIREDYIAQLDPYAHLLPERLRTRYRLERLRAEAARQAVEGPLRDTGCKFAEGVALNLVNKLLNIHVENAAGEIVETPGQYVEPVQLQIVCQSLWQNLPSEVRVIVDDHLERFGDVQQVLRSFYERAIDTAKRQTRVRESSLRRWFNDKLITPSGTRGTVFQGKEQTEGIANSAVDALEAQHIIRAEKRAGARWYELTHDRLIEPIRRSNAEAQARRFRRHAVALIAICIFAFTAVVFVCVFTHRLTVTADNGFVVTDPKKAIYFHAAKVTLMAVPHNGYGFKDWSGAVSDSNDPNTTLVMDEDKSVTANFVKIYSLTTSAADGSITKSPDQVMYNYGDAVILKAVPIEGYSFTNWSGALSGSTNPATLVMDADKSVTAYFLETERLKLKRYSLDTTARNGSVARSPDQPDYNYGETVTLEAVPNEGFHFTNWSGDLSDSNNPATLVMDGNKSVTVNFAALKAGDVITNSIGMKLVYIPAGTFKMGTPSDEKVRYRDKGPQHEVKISKSFWMGQTEVTQGQYESVMNAQPWSGMPGVQEDANNPAVYVSWEDAVDFCRRLSQKEGKTYRLPTEAEWEYACRAGTTTGFSFGDDVSSLSDYAWFADNTVKVNEPYAHPVGKKNPNPWGLYDMHGNVREWCSDWYGEDYYSNSPNDDPQGPTSGKYRCLRGGSWRVSESYLRCAYRNGYKPVLRLNFVGFRVVREPKTTYSLIVTAVNGSVMKIPDKASYHPGETVNLKAVPNKGYVFTKWSGGLSGSRNPAILLMNADKLVKANFALSWLDNIQVTIGKGTNRNQKLEAEGWKQIGPDLNRDAGGNYLYLWVRGPGKDDIRVTIGKGSNRNLKWEAEGWKQIGPDLNRDAGGNFLYLWVRGPGQDTILVTVGKGTNRNVTREAEGWKQIGPDLNRDAGGNYLYLWVR